MPEPKQPNIVNITLIRQGDARLVRGSPFHAKPGNSKDGERVTMTKADEKRRKRAAKRVEGA